MNKLKNSQDSPIKIIVLTTTAVADSPQTQSVWTPYLKSTFDDRQRYVDSTGLIKPWLILLSSSGPGPGWVKVRWRSGGSDLDLSYTIFLVLPIDSSSHTNFGAVSSCSLNKDSSSQIYSSSNIHSPSSFFLLHPPQSSSSLLKFSPKAPSTSYHLQVLLQLQPTSSSPWS